MPSGIRGDRTRRVMESSWSHQKLGWLNLGKIGKWMFWGLGGSGHCDFSSYFFQIRNTSAIGTPGWAGHHMVGFGNPNPASRRTTTEPPVGVVSGGGRMGISYSRYVALVL